MDKGVYRANYGEISIIQSRWRACILFHVYLLINLEKCALERFYQPSVKLIQSTKMHAVSLFLPNVTIIYWIASVWIRNEITSVYVYSQICDMCVSVSLKLMPLISTLTHAIFSFKTLKETFKSYKVAGNC